MPIYILDDEPGLPDPMLAGKDGLLALGGDLSPERLLHAYSKGIFPWYNEDSPILWWSPDPRMILVPQEFKRSKSFKQTINKGKFEVKFDEDFASVIRNCAKAGDREREGTWITPEMQSAYTILHEMGYAHSVEAYYKGNLAGGLYGISLGKVFYGESMFFIERDASKVALSALVDRLLDWEFHFIDVQQRTEHLRRLGAKAVKRMVFLEMLEKALGSPTIMGKW